MCMPAVCICGAECQYGLFFSALLHLMFSNSHYLRTFQRFHIVGRLRLLLLLYAFLWLYRVHLGIFGLLVGIVLKDIFVYKLPHKSG